MIVLSISLLCGYFVIQQFIRCVKKIYTYVCVISLETFLSTKNPPYLLFSVHNEQLRSTQVTCSNP